MVWSLESELCATAPGANNLEDALRHLGILGTAEMLVRWTMIADWVRGGAETHIYRFAVFTRIERKDLVLKAITPDPGPVSVENTLSDLVERRALLNAHGIATPPLFYFGRGLVLERWIPESLVETLRVRNEAATRGDGLLAQLAWYAAALDRLGFAPIDAFGDLRVEEGSLYAIDVGRDLGPPGVALDGRVADKALRNWLSQVCSVTPGAVDDTVALAVRVRALGGSALR